MHSKAVDKSIKSPANVFVRALLVKTPRLKVHEVTFQDWIYGNNSMVIPSDYTKKTPT